MTRRRGQVAVDLAAEAAKQKEIMKELRKSQMDKPPPVAMKKDPKTGEMVKFESDALKDDLPDEEVEDGEIEIPVGDDCKRSFTRISTGPPLLVIAT